MFVCLHVTNITWKRVEVFCWNFACGCHFGQGGTFHYGVPRNIIISLRKLSTQPW